MITSSFKQCNIKYGFLKVGRLEFGDVFFNGITPVFSKETTVVTLKCDDTMQNEGYSIIVDHNGITIIHKDYNGKLYAIMSIKQMLLDTNGVLPYCEIVDFPDTAYRGYMLDVGRYFFPIKDVLKQIEYCAFFKINAFHLHLSEDQGWRIEIKNTPALHKSAQPATARIRIYINTAVFIRKKT